MNTTGTITPGIPPIDTLPKAKTLLQVIEEDSRAVFMQSGGFAQPVSWEPKDEPSQIINAIYEAPTEGIDITGRVALTQPRLYAATSDLPRAKIGDRVTLNKIKYYATQVRVDGTGITTIELSEDENA